MSEACPLCGHAAARLILANCQGHDLLRCRDCGLGRLSPMPSPEALAALYASENYYRGELSGYDSYRDQEQSLRRTFAAFLRRLKAAGATGGALLEVGAGYGYLLDEARAYYRRRTGLELSAAAVDRARPLADEMHCGGLSALPAAARFDTIIATQVIEHVPEPRAFVAAAREHLQPGGALVLAAPDFGSFWRPLMGRRWPSLKVPEHVLYFDRRSLARLLREAGLERIQRLPYPHAFPLPLVAAKLGLRLPQALDRFSLWLPRTTVALVAWRPRA